jgi:hypothetical protein
MSLLCQFRFRTGKRLKQDYLLSLFRPARFQHLQQNQDQQLWQSIVLINENQGTKI